MSLRGATRARALVRAARVALDPRAGFTNYKRAVDKPVHRTGASKHRPGTIVFDVVAGRVGNQPRGERREGRGVHFFRAKA